ncbi:MAG: hypothetical protein LKG42_02970 [Eubacterium sp.]|jgi:hypothetical protein|nr:hypothetical protein [Eubacterium sp.]MCH4078619.1 hypothetical protein [Eubacterium sp.]MCH4109760.1 hypothetical protein [Eubacterium sp.]MCI1306968.1 hypothetical protein [Eubacterium sp.]MCI1428094.1 hypothetical protein [Eubacterium sp.]
MKDFTVELNGIAMPVEEVPWDSEEAKHEFDPNKEMFIGIDWKAFVTDTHDGYWEKGMTALSLAAYMLNNKSTHQ